MEETASSALLSPVHFSASPETETICRRIWRQSPKTATVSEFSECSRQCEQVFNKIVGIGLVHDLMGLNLKHYLLAETAIWPTLVACTKMRLVVGYVRTRRLWGALHRLPS